MMDRECTAAGRVEMSKHPLLIVALLLSSGGSVAAETIEVSDNQRGSVVACDSRWAGLAARGVDVKIVGPCQSACTCAARPFPRNKICVTPGASFGFHLANLPSATATLRGAYQSDITAWIDAHGGRKKDFIWMRAPDIYRFFKKC
jgi:hypothetical protein